MLRNMMFALPAVVVLLAASHVQAGCACGGEAVAVEGQASDCCSPCSGYVEKEVMCPTWTTETRKCMVTEYKQEQREKTYTVYTRVPETKQVEQTYTVMVPETRTKTVTYTVRKPVYSTVEKTYTVMVPQQETRKGTRTVCKPVMVEETRKVCEDQGHWETKTECVCCVDRCGCPQTKTVCKKVWVPNVVEKEVTVKCCKMEQVQEEYEYCVTVCKPEERTCQVKKCEWVCEEKTKECQYTVCVPQQKTRVCNVTTCKCVPVEKTCTYTVCVPVQVEKEVQVRVCKMVPKTIQVPCAQPCCQPSCEPSCCEPCCKPRCGLLSRLRARHAACCVTACGC